MGMTSRRTAIAITYRDRGKNYTSFVRQGVEDASSVGARKGTVTVGRRGVGDGERGDCSNNIVGA
jgi:hypothetical protein